jgi:cysteine desulfurase
MNDFIYLDHAATTPVHSSVLEAMLPFFSDVYGNPSSTHRLGQQARQALDQARHQIATQLGCAASELVFTSGGTESNNLAIRGILTNHANPHMITSQVEHHAVLHVCQKLEAEGCAVTYLAVDEQGKVDVDACERAITPQTALISVMFGNNEVGSLQPIIEIGALARKHGIAFHVDAAQALGNVDICLSDLPVDLMSFSAHKIGGPKGVGALYVHRAIKLEALQFGGSQERKRRAGTENIASIVGFAKAVELAQQQRQAKQEHLQQLRTTFLQALAEHLQPGSYRLNGSASDGLAHILNVSFPGIPSATMLMNLDLEGIAASAGSACSAGSLEPSHVLRAMQIPPECVQSAIRFSFGMSNNVNEIVKIVKKIETIYQRLRIT